MLKTYFSILVLSLMNMGEKNYVKDYYANRNLKQEGWLLNNEKVDYWFFYYENGEKKEEGHYKNNLKTKWWIYYNNNGEVIKKCEYKNDQLNGYFATFKNSEVQYVEKYKMNKKIKRWNSIADFRKDNPLLF